MEYCGREDGGVCASMCVSQQFYLHCIESCVCARRWWSLCIVACIFVFSLALDGIPWARRWWSVCIVACISAGLSTSAAQITIFKTFPMVRVPWIYCSDIRPLEPPICYDLSHVLDFTVSSASQIVIFKTSATIRVPGNHQLLRFTPLVAFQSNLVGPDRDLENLPKVPGDTLDISE